MSNHRRKPSCSHCGAHCFEHRPTSPLGSEQQRNRESSRKPKHPIENDFQILDWRTAKETLLSDNGTAKTLLSPEIPDFLDHEELIYLCKGAIRKLNNSAKEMDIALGCPQYLDGVFKRVWWVNTQSLCSKHLRLTSKKGLAIRQLTSVTLSRAQKTAPLMH